MKKIARFHALLSLSLFVFYIGLSLIYNPAFLFSDMRDKFQALADGTVAITGRVLGPPVVPIVSGVATCNNGTLLVTLVWPADRNSNSFGISRDATPLVTNLIDSQYKDSMVSVGKTYVYRVTAHGPMGSGLAVSAPISITTPAVCAVVLPPPAVTVIALAGQNIISSAGIPKIADPQPTFSGTINVPNAEIHLEVHSEVVIVADIQANENGYWSWTPPVKLPLGSHTLFIVATDPLDPTRTIIASQDFTIVKNEVSSGNSSNNSSSHKTKKTAPVSAPIVITKAPPGASISETPLDFSLKLAKETVLQSKNLTTEIDISRLDANDEKANAIIKYDILDKNGQVKESFLDNVVLSGGEKIARNLPIPAYYKEGPYEIQVEVMLGQYDISRIKSFSVLPLPVLNLGGGIVATYPQVLSQLGTASLWLLLGLLIWLLLFSREYWLYLHALRHITEENLARLGMFGTRKRKGVSH